MSAPEVSVILAAYNAERYIREAVESILAQRFSDFEFLVVDDGSTDATAEIVRSYLDPRIRLIGSARNGGLTRSLNRALGLATGEYIARQDADDVSEPERLGQQVAFLNRHPGVGLVGSWFTAIDAAGAVLRRTRLPVHDLDLRWEMFFSCPLVHGAVMWRRSIVEQAGRYDERFTYSQDYELWTRVALRAAISNVPQFLVRYREHDASMTATYGERTREGHRLRVAAVTAALDWREPRVEACDARFRNMAALLHRSQPERMTPEQSGRAAADLLDLHAVLCRENQIESTAAGRHQRTLRGGIRRGLIRVARRTARERRIVDASRVLAAALRSSWLEWPRRRAAPVTT